MLLTIIITTLISGMLLMLYCCLKAASIADDQLQKMHQEKTGRYDSI